MNSIDIQVIACMQTYGGSFVKSLAQTYTLADPQSRDTIKDAFPEYWMRYLKMALDMETEDEE